MPSAECDNCIERFAIGRFTHATLRQNYSARFTFGDFLSDFIQDDDMCARMLGEIAMITMSYNYCAIFTDATLCFQV